MGFSFLTQELAIDLGTANTVIFQNDQIVLDEPSIVALDNNSGKLIALGHQAKLIQDRENPGIKTIRPLRDGVIADFNAAELMIRGFIKQVNSKRRSLFTPNLKVVVGIPSGSTEVEIRAVRDSTEHAGGRDVYLIFEPMAAALGIGLDVEAPRGSMVVDIGGGTTEIAVISLGGIVQQNSVRVAGDVFTNDIQYYLKQQHNIKAENSCRRRHTEPGRRTGAFCGQRAEPHDGTPCNSDNNLSGNRPLSGQVHRQDRIGHPACTGADTAGTVCGHRGKRDIPVRRRRTSERSGQEAQRKGKHPVPCCGRSAQGSRQRNMSGSQAY